LEENEEEELQEDSNRWKGCSMIHIKVGMPKEKNYTLTIKYK
jgi:hypothetical protein